MKNIVYTTPATETQPPTKVMYMVDENTFLVKVGLSFKEFFAEEALEFAFSIVRLIVDFGEVNIEQKIGEEWQKILLSSSGTERESDNSSDTVTEL